MYVDVSDSAVDARLAGIFDNGSVDSYTAAKMAVLLSEEPIGMGCLEAKVAEMLNGEIPDFEDSHAAVLSIMGSRLGNHLRRRVHLSEEDFKDIISASMLKAISKTGDFKQNGENPQFAYRGWLGRIVINEYKTHLRTDRKHGAEHLGKFSPEATDNLAEKCGSRNSFSDYFKTCGNPESVASANELASVLSEDIKLLGVDHPPQKEILLRTAAGERLRDIACSMGYKETTARTYLFRAREHVMAHIEQKGFGEQVA